MDIKELLAGLGRAVSEGLSSHDAAKHEKAEAEKLTRAQAEDARRIAKKRADALDHVVRTFEQRQAKKRAVVGGAVARYCEQARDKATEPLKKDPRMPRTINYLDRYCALKQMDDRSVMLRRLKATIDLADEILAAGDHSDVRGALIEASMKYGQGVMGLDGIRVVGAEPLPEDEDAGTRPELGESFDASEITRAIEASFGTAIGNPSELEVRVDEEAKAAEMREKMIDEQIEEATRAAMRAGELAAYAQAQQVTDAVLLVEQPEVFNGDVVVKVCKDFDLVRALSAEVHQSFGVFSQVVTHNGLFAAFANDGSYGSRSSLRGQLFFDEYDDEYDDERPSRRPVLDVSKEIPTAVEEDDGGDSLEKAIERMRQFNKQRYWGMLDDDFAKHVDAFWYGFKKLMENVNGLFECDLRPFYTYCKRVSRVVESKAAELGVRMDQLQIEVFLNEVDKRKKAL